MLGLFRRLVEGVRTLSQSFFLQFGLHCATHQIRVILISCIVITSLFYPALAIYSSNQAKIPTVFDAFAPLNGGSAPRAEEDLVNLWSKHDSLRTHDDAVARGKCGSGGALRVERIFIQSPQLEDDGALNNRILASTLDFEERLNMIIKASDEVHCLEKPDGSCIVLSPLAFWNYDRALLSDDDSILDTLSQPQNVSIAGIPVSPEMVLAGRGSYEHHVKPHKFDYATFLAITYFFPDSDCSLDHEHAHWLQMVEKAASKNSFISVQPQGPSLIALDFNQHRQGWSAISAFLWLAYAGFFAYVAYSFSRMSTVHSRLGVIFTALVEITVSTITSLSVCALVGFRITMIPWELAPIVIVFVGAENMFSLVDAVGKTSVTLPVKQRIAEGLSRAGTSNTLKVVASNIVLGILAVFAVGAVRQFCTFAIVVLVAHWFLAHTFFIAVLSIDIARLELEELLRHDSSLAPSLASGNKYHSAKQSNANLPIFHRLLKSRAAANSSLVMLLAISATLYYATSTPSTLPQPQVPKHLGAVARAKSTPSASLYSQRPMAEHIWHVLNPDQRSLLHLRIEAPVVVTLDVAGKSVLKKKKDGVKSHRTRRTINSAIWIMKIMLLPIGLTTGLLYNLLVYLLKDTELLESQHHNAETESVTEEERALDSQVSFSTLPRAIASDIELIASSSDGKVVVSVGLHNEIIVWNAEAGSYLSIDARDVLDEPSTLGTLSSLTSLTVDNAGHLVAIGTNTGLIAVWVLVGTKVTSLPILALDDVTAAVTELHFVSSQPARSEKKQAIPPPAFPVILATYEDGAAARWSIERSPFATRFFPSRDASVVKSSLLRFTSDATVVFAFSLDDGTIDIHETLDYDKIFLETEVIRPGTSLDHVCKVYACRAKLNGSDRPIIAAATASGTITLWDGSTGECISVLDELQGRVNTLRISPVACDICHFCGNPPPETLSVAFSVDHIVKFYNLCINDQQRRCSCAHSQLRHISSRELLTGRRSRSSSTASSLKASPRIPRPRLGSAFEASDFPVSAHGVRPRRASEKEARRSLEQLAIPLFSQQEDQDPRNRSGSTTPVQSSLWHNVVVIKVGEQNCERGGWDVSTAKFVGVRRKPRSQGVSKGGTTLPVSLTPSAGLTKATLERWEIWTFDPASARIRCSRLSDLSLKPLERRKRCSSSASSSPPPSPSHDGIPRLPFTRVAPLMISPSHALAGFGNTIGVFDFSPNF